jgi:hypothetical protein
LIKKKILFLVPPSDLQSIKTTVPPPISSSTISPSNIPRKALCVIINIKAFIPSKSTEIQKSRAGSDKDVELIRFVFKKLKFTVLECRHDFTKNDLNDALNHINDQNEYADFDCLVMFIMSHG